MQIKGTEWYTACGTKFAPIKGSERTQVKTLYGYRMPVSGRDEEEIKALVDQLKADGVEAKLKTSKHDHSGVPSGTPFLQVLDEKSAIALEKIFLESGITLETDRYKEYGLEYINRTPKPIAPAVKRSFFERLFGRK